MAIEQPNLILENDKKIVPIGGSYKDELAWLNLVWGTHQPQPQATSRPPRREYPVPTFSCAVPPIGEEEQHHPSPMWIAGSGCCTSPGISSKESDRRLSFSKQRSRPSALPVGVFVANSHRKSSPQTAGYPALERAMRRLPLANPLGRSIHRPLVRQTQMMASTTRYLDTDGLPLWLKCRLHLGPRPIGTFPVSVHIAIHDGSAWSEKFPA